MKSLQGIIGLPITVMYTTQTIFRKMSNAPALKGYDPVAYFLEKKASKGKSEFRYEWDGVHWLFSSQANLNAFKADPEKYIPQYGGLCAFGVSMNRKVYADPEVWTIFDNRLYLNYNLKTRELWLRDTAFRIQKGNAFWSSLNQ